MATSLLMTIKPSLWNEIDVGVVALIAAVELTISVDTASGVELKTSTPDERSPLQVIVSPDSLQAGAGENVTTPHAAGDGKTRNPVAATKPSDPVRALAGRMVRG